MDELFQILDKQTAKNEQTIVSLDEQRKALIQKGSEHFEALSEEGQHQCNVMATMFKVQDLAVAERLKMQELAVAGMLENLEEKIDAALDKPLVEDVSREDDRSCTLKSFELVKAWYFARFVLIQLTKIERYVASHGTRPVSKMRDIDFEKPLTLRWYGENSACKKYFEYLEYLQQNGRFPPEIHQAVREANAKYKASQSS
jgi:hypothetical protein